MVNSYYYWNDGSKNLIKSCNKNITHSVTFTSLIRDHDEVNKITIPWGPDCSFRWALHAEEKYKLILQHKKGETKLPFFEPDLSNYRKLVNKLKTYLVFL